jgi:hypothetical protein
MPKTNYTMDHGYYNCSQTNQRWAMHPDRLLNRTAVALLVLYKAFLASLRSALTAQSDRCAVLVGFCVRNTVPALGQEELINCE